MALSGDSSVADSRLEARFHVKIATEAWEFEAIHRLNYETFVDEIPQHRPDPSGRLIDRFHEENTYIVCIHGTLLLGMVAVRDRRPFSLEHKLPDFDSYLPAFRRVCELRLLAVQRQQRTSPVLQRLLGAVFLHCLEQQYDAAVISGTTRQLKLYRRIGFVPFGPLVGSSTAQFQPMFVTIQRAGSRARKLLRVYSPFEEDSSARKDLR
jgi:hypothetical protein